MKMMSKDDCLHPDNIRALLELGLLHEDDDKGEIFVAWGKLVRDPVITSRASALPRNPESPAMVAAGSTLTVLEAMNKSDRALLRERLSNVTPIPARA
jgi:phosphoenolpyruvate-protein kinase (PTS system EI component)